MPIQIPFPLGSQGFATKREVRINLDFIVSKFNEFNSGTATWDTVAIGSANSLTGSLTLYNDSNAYYLQFLPSESSTQNQQYTFPTAYPTVTGKFLKSTGAGIMSWSTISDLGSFVGNRALYVDGVGQLFEIDPGSGNKVMVNSSPPSFFSLLGTTNQITVTPNAGNFTLSTPQDIGTSSTVDFGKVRINSGGVFSTPDLVIYKSPSAANTGFFSTGSDIRFSTAGTLAGVIDGITLTMVGDIATTGNIILQHGSGNITLQSPGSAIDGSYTLTLPENDGGSGEVLTTNGSGVLSWTTPSGTGANAALSNLASVAINTTLVSDTNNTDDLGTSSIRWKDLFLSGVLNNSATSNQIVLGTTRTVTFTAPTPASASRTITFPDLSADYSVVGTAGSQTVGGAKTFTSSMNPQSSVLINASGASARSMGGFYTPSTQIEGTSDATTGFSIIRNSNDTQGGTIFMGKSRGTTNGSSTVVATDDVLGTLKWVGADGSDIQSNGAEIRVTVEATPGSNDMPCRLEIRTTPDGDVDSAVRLNADSKGNVIINTAAIATNATNGFLYVPTCAGTPTGTPTTYTGRAPIVVDTTNHKLYFYDGSWRDAGP